MRYKISLFILSFSLIFTSCSDSKSSKRSSNVVNIKDCLDSIYSTLKKSNNTFQAIQKMDINNKLSNLYRLTYKNDSGKIKIDFIEIKKDCSFSKID
tara:strand:+ start:252 stop:542 length:291 start_codon:yes stop_codon:yes gene_type:complete